ncbi:MAG: GMC family oxidoreductase [Saprospiraceae bacterium]|nr:MAG: GMC family oxidoreductase [Saprospiraceae bacterium]
MSNINGKAQQARTYDAIVAGSGISGGWAAKELTEKGLDVLLLERGRNLEHVKDYKGALNNPWDLKYRGRITEELKASHEIQSQCYAFQPDNADFWINDKENPYIQGKPFNWLRGDHLGGRSLMWGRQSYRWSEMDFESNARDGHGTDWPIRYKDLAPWYDYVETFAGISGSPEGLPQLPDGKFLPPMEMNCVETHIAGAMKKNWDARRMIIGRVANLTQPTEVQTKLGRGKCQFRNRCHWGCPYGAYFSSLSATLPAARNTGKLTIRTDANVSEVIFDNEKQRASGVRIINRKTKQTEEFFAKIVFLNASTLGTAFILLNSKSSRFPDGLGNDSGVIGHYLMDHHYGVGATGVYDGFNDQYYSGRRANGIYVPRFRNLPGREQEKDFVRGYGFQGGAGRGGWDRNLGQPGFGESLKKEMMEPGHWGMWLGGWGECLPHFDNKVSLDTAKTDQYGLPVLKVDCEFRDNEIAMRQDIMQAASEILEASGSKEIHPFDDLATNPPGHCIHEMGTCRMGKDPKTSALNGWNQMWAVKNVFVTDGACMASSACQNPSLTYMALTARAANRAVDELKRGNL